MERIYGEIFISWFEGETGRDAVRGTTRDFPLTRDAQLRPLDTFRRPRGAQDVENRLAIKGFGKKGFKEI